MPRYTNDDNSEIFRAVVTETTKRPGEADHTFTQTFGPYSTRAQARAQVTREKKAAQRANDRARIVATRMGIEPRFEIVVTGRVERTAVNWEEA